MRKIVEDRRDRLALIEDAGLGRLSLTCVLAGVLVGYGGFAVLAGLAAAVLGRLNVDVDLRQNFEQVGAAGAVALGVVLFLSYLFGGYVAGRMARRAGATHGVTVFFTGLLIAVATAGVVEASGATQSATQSVVDGLRSLGVPTSGEQWRQIGTVAGIASLAGMFLGALFGGALGERWHMKLMSRAVDPEVGPEAMARSLQPKVARARRRRREIVLTDVPPAPAPVTGGVVETGKETGKEKTGAKGSSMDKPTDKGSSMDKASDKEKSKEKSREGMREKSPAG